MLSIRDVALFRAFPMLEGKLVWVRLGDWPTPVEPLVGLPGARVPVYVKREDRASTIYGGNKVRTLEAIMGLAVESGADTIWATGAYGSNHATATVLHARHAGLRAGLALFPQPQTTTAQANLSAMLSTSPMIEPIRHAVELPVTMARLRRRSMRAYVMAPGGAIPRGTFGAMSAGLELAEQVEAGECPRPSGIVLAVGSTCTTAGLLAGLHLAHALGIGFRSRAAIPMVTAVRVTPWPITSAVMILRLSYRASLYIARLTGAPVVGVRALHRTLTVERRFFGSGYGQPTVDGLRAQQIFEGIGGPPLDFVYSAKSGAALLDMARARRTRAERRGPILFWATKSSMPLPRASAIELARAPRSWQTWLRV